MGNCTKTNNKDGFSYRESVLFVVSYGVSQRFHTGCCNSIVEIPHDTPVTC